MRNLPLPLAEPLRSDLERALSTYRYRGETRGYQGSAEEIEAIIELYEAYDRDSGRASGGLEGGHLDDALLNAVYEAFSQLADKRRLADVRKALLKDVDRCPICGISVAWELDHFLPRSAFKALAIYRRNLVPLCHDCNNIKSDRAGEGGEDHFVHAYFDQLPDRDLIRATAEIDGRALTFHFEVIEDDGDDGELLAKLKHQFVTLKLPARFLREINNYLFSHAQTLHMMWDVQGEAGVRLFLARQIAAETARHHRNDWRVATLRALANHVGFCTGQFQDVLPLPAAVRAAAAAFVAA